MHEFVILAISAQSGVFMRVPKCAQRRIVFVIWLFRYDLYAKQKCPKCHVQPESCAASTKYHSLPIPWLWLAKDLYACRVSDRLSNINIRLNSRHLGCSSSMFAGWSVIEFRFLSSPSTRIEVECDDGAYCKRTAENVQRFPRVLLMGSRFSAVSTSWWRPRRRASINSL